MRDIDEGWIMGFFLFLYILLVLLAILITLLVNVVAVFFLILVLVLYYSPDMYVFPSLSRGRFQDELVVVVIVINSHVYVDLAIGFGQLHICNVGG
jgi:hypothetical protein